MIDQHLLDVVIRVELGFLVLALGLFFAHGTWLLVFGRRIVRHTSIGRAALVAALERASLTESENSNIAVADFPEVAQLRRIPKELTAGLFLELSRNVAGAGNIALRELADVIGLTRRARKMCRSRRWTHRLTGARVLCQLGEPDPVIGALLRDPAAAVRAQAAEWAGAFPRANLIGEMLDLLGDSETLCRFAVEDALLRMGPTVVPPLTEFLSGHSGAAAESGMKVAASMPDPLFLDSGLRFSNAGDPALRSAAAELLGAVGGESSSERLVALLDDVDAGVQAEAARALGKMIHWPAGPRLAQLLCHSNWKVRHAAGRALRSIGGSGVLLLRRATRSADPFAADMAQLILGLPEAAR